MCDRDGFECVTGMVLSQTLQYDTRYPYTCATAVTEASPIDFPLFGHVTLVQKRYVKLDNGVASDVATAISSLQHTPNRISKLRYDYENMRET